MKAVPQLDRRHMPEDFVAALGGIEVEGVVFVEVDAAPEENFREVDFVTAITGGTLPVLGCVASVRLDSGQAAAGDLERLAAMPLVRGIRHLVQQHVDEPGWALREDFVAGVQALAAHGLSFDLCVLHPQMGDAVELVRRCPDVRFVLDHIGKPGIRAGLTEPWIGEMTRLAELPNVLCKISGATTEADHDAWTEAEVAPYLRHAIDCFGYERCMFGGDWPVSTLATDYRRWVDLVDLVTADANSGEKRRLFRDTARDFYRL
jgi:L-fuconolactonase